MAPVTALRLYYFVAFGAFGLYLPFFPAWVEARGFQGVWMSAIVSLLPALSLTSPPLVGMLADKLGLRGQMMTIAASTTAFGLTLLALSGYALVPLPFWAAFGSVLVFALLRAPTVGLADALTIELTPNYGRVRLFGSLGFLTTALIGGRFIVVEDPVQLPLLVASCLWLLVLFSTLLPKASTLPPQPALSEARRLLAQPGFRWLLLTIVTSFGAISGYDLCASLRMRELGATSGYIGAFWATATAAEVILLYLAAPHIERWGAGRLLTLACLTGAGRWAFLSEADSLTWILALQPLHAVTFGLMWISAMSVLKRETAGRATATGQGLFGSAMAIGATLGIWFWGPLYESAGASSVFRYAALVALAAALIASRLIRHSRPLRENARPAL